jgi:hypothetical protein
VNQQQPERIGEALPAQERLAEWVRPEVDTFIAGAAEATDGADTDGVTLS